MKDIHTSRAQYVFVVQDSTCLSVCQGRFFQASIHDKCKQNIFHKYIRPCIWLDYLDSKRRKGNISQQTLSMLGWYILVRNLTCFSNDVINKTHKLYSNEENWVPCLILLYVNTFGVFITNQNDQSHKPINKIPVLRVERDNHINSIYLHLTMWGNTNFTKT